MWKVISAVAGGAIAVAIITPMQLLNTFGGIASGIWLAILGEWVGIGVGLWMIIFGPRMCGRLIDISMFFARKALSSFGEDGVIRPAGYMFSVFVVIWTWFSVSSWGVFNFFLFLSMSNSATLMPYLILAYFAATWPWVYLEARSYNPLQPNLEAGITVLFLEIACVTAVVMIGFFEAPLQTVFWTSIGIMGVRLAWGFSGAVRSVIKNPVEQSDAEDHFG